MMFGNVTLLGITKIEVGEGRINAFFDTDGGHIFKIENARTEVLVSHGKMPTTKPIVYTDIVLIEDGDIVGSVFSCNLGTNWIDDDVGLNQIVTDAFRLFDLLKEKYKTC